MKIKFENHSISGIFREYAGFILNIPGHALGAKAVVATVPDELATDVRKYLASNHPAIVVTEVGEEDIEAAAIAAKEAAEKAEAERLAAEEAEALAAKEKEEAEQAAAAKEAAEKAEAAKAKKGGR